MEQINVINNSLFSSIFNITTDYLPVLSGRNAGNRVFKNHLDAKGCCTDFLFGVGAFLIAGLFLSGPCSIWKNSTQRAPVKYSCPEKDIFRPAAWNAFGMDKEGADYRACAAYGPFYKK